MVFTVSSSKPALEVPNGQSLSGYLSTWLFCCFSSSTQIFPSFSSPSFFYNLVIYLFLFFSSKDPGAYEFYWHLNPEPTCPKSWRTWGLVESGRHGGSLLSLSSDADPIGYVQSGTWRLWHFGKAMMGGPIKIVNGDKGVFPARHEVLSLCGVCDGLESSQR